jgi:hypothetical protein
LEDAITVLTENRSVQVAYSTTFLINWPEHLGGDQVKVDFDGTMTLVPLMLSD